MKLIFVAFKYFKKYPILSTAILFLIAVASFFDGASFGLIIPLIQSMTSGSAELFKNIPLLQNLGFLFSPEDQTKTVSLIFIFIFMSILVKNIFLYYSTLFIAKLRFSVIRDLKISLMNNLLRYDTKFFDGVKTGHIIGNITTETQRMGDFMQATLRFMAQIIRVSVYVLILFLISWKASLVIFVLITTVLVPIEFLMRRIKKFGEKRSQAIASYTYKLTELLNGMKLIKTCGSEDVERRSFKREADGVYKFQYKSGKYGNLIVPFSEVCIFGLISLCFLIVINVVKVDIVSTFPFVAAYLVVLARMLTQLNNLNSNRGVAMDRLAAFAGYQDMHSEKGKITIKSGHREIGKFSNSIEFKNIEFSYIRGKKVLKGINIKIPKGTITALVGPSGAGKSTMVNLIPRFYDIDSGEILVDGVSLKELALKNWRSKIGFVSQDVFIFNTDLKNNISYGHKDVSDAKIIEAAKAANAHDFIEGLTEGYDTVLGERGVKLSAGQKQRISIARAIFHNPEVLILDEATSSLDTETERLITSAIDRLTKGRTVIAIAHRLSTILHADNIIVLDEGRIVEQGKHVNLLRKNGLYKKLYDVQFSVEGKSSMEVLDEIA